MVKHAVDTAGYTIPLEEWSVILNCTTTCHTVEGTVCRNLRKKWKCRQMMGFTDGISGKEPGCQCKRHNT